MRGGPGSRKNNPEFERTVGPKGGVGYRRKNKAVEEQDRRGLGNPLESGLEDDGWDNEGPLERVTLESQSTSVRSLVDPELRDSPELGLIMDPPYQRGEVWGEERKRNLVRSMMMGIPVGAIVVNDRWDGGMAIDPTEPARAVVDGKQRVSALRDFRDDKFTVPRRWWRDELVNDDAHGAEEVSYSDLSTLGKRVFRGWTIPMIIGKVGTVEEEGELFDLINYGGVPQGESDL